MGSVLQVARLDAYDSAPGAGLGLYVAAVRPIQIANIGFAFDDSTGALYNLGPQANGGSGIVAWKARLVVLLGLYGGDPATFAAATKLAAYVKKIDVVVNTITGVISFAGAQSPAESDRGEGLTILLGTPELFTSGPYTAPSVTAKLFGSTASVGAAAAAGGFSSAPQAASGVGVSLGSKPGGGFGHLPTK